VSQEADLMLKNLMILASTEKSSRNSYYEKVFAKILNGKKLSWNWSACLFSMQWMPYRKMYGLGLLIYILWILLCAATYVWISYAIGASAPMWVPCIFWLVGLISFLSLIGAFGNYLYFIHLKKKLEKNYHLANTFKNVDRISMLLFFIFPILAFVSGVIVSIKDRIKVSKALNERGVK